MIPFTHAEVVNECMLQSVKARKLKKKIPENSFIKRHYHLHCNEFANNISCQLVSEISQSSCFSLDADEATDISDIAQLSVFVQYFNGERFVEELLGLISLYGRTTGEIIFNEI
ncbi:hypothetical protein PR048_012517 [Dryococelus australis]|uniref:Uncharacterized protein n=1 Tax=Dryococelus australis TaxID=614101 RepID=A0ABQ9HPL8_9NEOP|nr:hypothetical protein PR048_012517 [Dryococelus australis]